ncbi:hypothetical protein GSY74_00920 [Sulfurovum sp. bin170]|uniref:hypothetical protein n=1 Tax=Sulfurovum sp. bin170 TaxID=2695268 RepID=UPI0013E05C3C|nr:hypothetical protein [Sulfurovum sp. bin170]NEW59830.1 hypothetical protein [Sulfurovum sp. bin170]
MKSNRVIYSTILIMMLAYTGCGSDSSSNNGTNSDTQELETDNGLEMTAENERLLNSEHKVVVERGAVLDANVTDANGSVATQVSETNNTYIFEEQPEYPIQAEGGWIDVNGDGNLTELDVELDITLISYSDNITPTTTYLADENETVREERLDELARETNSTADDLTELPSRATKNSIMVLNAVYKKLIERQNEHSNAPIAIERILEKYREINATVEVDENATSEEIALAIEEQTIADLEEKGLIKRVNREDIERIKDKKPPKIKDNNGISSRVEEESGEIGENNQTEEESSSTEENNNISPAQNGNSGNNSNNGNNGNNGNARDSHL